MRQGALGALLLVAGMTVGCVERRYVINSDPPGTLVYVNNKPLGTTPVDGSFVYYGKYHFTLVKDGYETLQVEEDFSTPWYEYPPLDLITENIWPFKVRDVRRPSYQMQPLQQVRQDELLGMANALRARGAVLVPFNPESVPGKKQQTAPPPPPVVGPVPEPVPVPTSPYNATPPPVTSAPAPATRTPPPVSTTSAAATPLMAGRPNP